MLPERYGRWHAGLYTRPLDRAQFAGAGLGAQPGRPALLVDRAYEGDLTRRLAVSLGWCLVVAAPHPREPWQYDRVLYKQRNIVEQLFCRLKDHRRIATRVDKLDRVFLAFNLPRPEYRRLLPLVRTGPRAVMFTCARYVPTGRRW